MTLLMMRSGQTPVVQRVPVLHPRASPLFVLMTYSVTGSCRIHNVPTEKQQESHQPPAIEGAAPASLILLYHPFGNSPLSSPTALATPTRE